MGIPIDGGFADVEDTFKPLPEGVYSAKVAGGEVRVAGENAKYPGSKYIAWEFAILEEGYEKRKLWSNTSLRPEARVGLFRFLKALGIPEDDLKADTFEIGTEDESEEVNDERIIGAACRLVVEGGVNPRTDEPNNNVKRVLPPTDEQAALP